MVSILLYITFTKVDAKTIELNLGTGTVNSRINDTPKCVGLPVSKLHSILAVANLLAQNNKTICYYGQVNSLRLKSSVTSKWASKQLWE